ncbi:MAG: nitroreductase family protein [Bacillota bacterium]
MVEVFEAIAKRRSIRAYKNEAVPEESLAKVLEAARISPTAGNRQEYKFVVVKDEATRKALVPACNNQSFVGDAGVVIVGCATNPGRRYSPVDVAIALDHMTLAATSLGLGTCWIGAFSEEKVKEVLGIPEGVTVVCLLPLGVPATEGAMRPRKTKEELFPVDRW